jgi:hypothetical protein
MAINDNYHVCPGRGGCQHCQHVQVTPAPWWQFAPPVLPQPSAGWQCPRCEKVHAPSVLSCPCSDSLRDRIGRGMAT